MNAQNKLTTIQLHEETKNQLGKRKLVPRETYEDVIKRLLEGETK